MPPLCNCYFIPKLLSYGIPTLFSGTNPDAFGEVLNEYLAVADIAGLGTFHYGIYGRFNEGFINGYLQADFFEQPASLFSAAINLRYTFLSATTKHITYSLQMYL